MACRYPTFVFAILPLIVLWGCSPATPRPPESVVAKVNGEDISVHRFQLLRARADGEPAQGVDPSRLMDGLVDRVLFAQKATKLELDRRGFVPLAIEEARTDILARAYVDSLLGSDDEREVDKFYAEHPQLFRE